MNFNIRRAKRNIKKRNKTRKAPERYKTTEVLLFYMTLKVFKIINKVLKEVFGLTEINITSYNKR